MYIQYTFYVRLLKVLSQLPDLPDRSKPSVLDKSNTKNWVRPAVHDTIQSTSVKLEIDNRSESSFNH